MTLAAAEIRLRIVEAVLPRLTFPNVQRPAELLDALRDVELWILGDNHPVGARAAATKAEPSIPWAPLTSGGIQSAATPKPADTRRRGNGPTREDQMFEALLVCAREQKPVPTTYDLSQRLGMTYVHAATLMSKLSFKGRIKVENQGSRNLGVRRVLFPGLGLETPWSVGTSGHKAAPVRAEAKTPTVPAAAKEPTAHRSTLRRFPSVEPRSRDVVPLRDDHPAVRQARTLFPTTVVEPADSPRLFVSGHNSRKIGKTVEKGPWRGFPIYTLTLEERATCPSSCHHWGTCFGNAMPFARRHKHGAELIALLHAEMVDLQHDHPAGFAVRLHVLGDFWSAEYAMEWTTWLAEFPALHIFGYTARPADGEIGRIVAMTNQSFPSRHRILFSVPESAPFAPGQAITVKSTEPRDDMTICPAETGATEACATCGLCWNPAATETKRIAFLLHGMTGGKRKAAAQVQLQQPPRPPRPEVSRKLHPGDSALIEAALTDGRVTRVPAMAAEG